MPLLVVVAGAGFVVVAAVGPGVFRPVPSFRAFRQLIASMGAVFLPDNASFIHASGLAAGAAVVAPPAEDGAFVVAGATVVPCPIDGFPGIPGRFPPGSFPKILFLASVICPMNCVFQVLKNVSIRSRGLGVVKHGSPSSGH